jgi:outer membrane murein-binding lipoprotein Lpp
MTPRAAWLRTVVLGAALASGCTHFGCDLKEKMEPLGPAVLKLSAAADSTISVEKPAAGMEEGALLALATRYNPDVLAPFAGYAVRIRAEEDRAIILVCDSARRQALFEDAGCSPALDRKAWQESGSPPCEFTLHTRAACPLPAGGQP